MKPVGWSLHRWKNNIKMLRIGMSGRLLVNRVMNMQVPNKLGIS
jgi:hypothetical protein